MATTRQILGAFGESAVVHQISCPRCKRSRALKKLPTNFRCADVICDFCGYLAQVKAVTVSDPTKIPDQVLGAAWKPQKERMDSGIYFPLFLVLYRGPTDHSIYYLPADLKKPEMFVARRPLSATAKRAGWCGFYYCFRGSSRLFTLLHREVPNE